MAQPHEARDKVFGVEGIMALEGWVSTITREIARIEDIAKEVDGDPSRSPMYDGYVELRNSLRTMGDICKGQYTHTKAYSGDDVSHLSRRELQSRARQLKALEDKDSDRTAINT